MGLFPRLPTMRIVQRDSDGKAKRTLLLGSKVDVNDPLGQYHCFEVGVMHADGAKDSIVIGGAFSTAKSFLKKLEDDANATEATAAA